jgi:sulfatase modifying factor 1
MIFWRATPGGGSLDRRGKLGMLGLVASIGCSGSNGGSGDGRGDVQTKDATSSSSGGPGGGAKSTSYSGSEPGMDSGPTGGADTGSGNGADSGSTGVADSGSISGGDSRPLSCAPGGAGMSNCGSSSESCCTSLEVTGGTYDRTYANSGGSPSGEADPATVSTFWLDKYEVTVGRFRQFVDAWNGGAGYAPSAGSGKHAHLNGGNGLANSSSDAGGAGAYEMGWAASDDSNIAPTNANLACEPKFDTWTPSVESRENLPINCVNWYEAYAFCIWDGGFLPSEAEWEYAAAGGIRQQRYPWGSTDPGTTNQYAIYDCHYPSGSGSCTGGAAPVGTASLGAGLWGQLDLAGNVNEWNLDFYASYGAPCADCAYLTTAGSYRVIRGGYFYNFASYLLPSGRSDDPPSVRSVCIGFRCARSAP